MRLWTGLVPGGGCKVGMDKLMNIVLVVLAIVAVIVWDIWGMR